LFTFSQLNPASHLKGLISCDNTPERSGSVPAMKKQIPISRFPRRIIRLMHQVARIEWDACPNEEAARQREELLICVLAPRFNRMGKV